MLTSFSAASLLGKKMPRPESVILPANREYRVIAGTRPSFLYAVFRMRWAVANPRSSFRARLQSVACSTVVCSSSWGGVSACHEAFSGAFLAPREILRSVPLLLQDLWNYCSVTFSSSLLQVSRCCPLT